MLKQITIQDYAIVESLDIDLAGGMTVITGETGAGKSIMLDALGLCIVSQSIFATLCADFVSIPVYIDYFSFILLDVE